MFLTDCISMSQANKLPVYTMLFVVFSKTNSFLTQHNPL